ncbi:MAG: flagellar motor switch protein FliN [Burkholderiales bacterium]
MTRSFTREIGAALAEDLAIVVGALVDAQAEVVGGAPTGGAQWQAEVLVGGTASGSCTVAFHAEAAAAVTGLIMGLGEQVPAEAVIDTFRELCSQALGALTLKPVARGATLTLGALAPAPELEPGNEWAVYAIGADKLPAPLTVTIWGDLKLASEQPVSKPVAAARPVAAPAPMAAAQPSGDRLDVILDIDLPLVVRFGRTELPLKSLTRLGPGSLIDLGRSPDDPVEILVSNRLVARGEVVIVSGNYGIRILDVVSPRDRM